MQVRLGFLNEDSFAKLKADLENNFDLVSFEPLPSTAIGNINKDVKKFMEFICARNKLFKDASNFKDAADIGIDTIGSFMQNYELQQYNYSDNIYKAEQVLQGMARDIASLFVKDVELPQHNYRDKINAIEQIFQEMPMLLAKFKSYMGEEIKDPKDYAQFIERLQSLKPESLGAMLKYHLSHTIPPTEKSELDDKIKLILYLLAISTVENKKGNLNLLIYNSINKKTLTTKLD